MTVGKLRHQIQMIESLEARIKRVDEDIQLVKEVASTIALRELKDQLYDELLAMEKEKIE